MLQVSRNLSEKYALKIFDAVLSYLTSLFGSVNHTDLVTVQKCR